MVELRQIKLEQPELATAVDMQLALVDMQRRVQLRVPLPWIQVDPDWMRTQQAAGRPLVRFSDIPLEWSDFRLTFRQTADILQRFDALDRADHQKIVAMGRDGNALEPLVTAWYDATSGVTGADPRRRAPSDAPASPRPGTRPRAAPVSCALGRSTRSEGRFVGLDPRSLSVLRMGAGICRHHADSRSPSCLRAMFGAVAVCGTRVPVLPERRPRAHHLVRDTRRTLPRVGVRRLPALPEGVRRAARDATADGGGGHDRDAAARRRRDAAGLQRVGEGS